MYFTQAAILAALAVPTEGYGPGERTFAVIGFYGAPLVSRMDPIRSPGAPSGHVHAIEGGDGFDLEMSDGQALKSMCTSSMVKADKSNYWTPSLYFQDPKNGSFISVPFFYMKVYYFFDSTNDTIEAFPPGLRMVSGNPSLRVPPKTGGRSILDLKDGTPQPVQFTCPRKTQSEPLYPPASDGLNGVGIQDPSNKGSGVGFPDKNCDENYSPLRADVHFPSCYNRAKGVRDYRNNMEWPKDGSCPPGYLHTPHLFYEVYWDTPKFEDMWTSGQGKQPFLLSNGDTTGYGLHGDFISGWDIEALQQIIDHCNVGNSGMHKCPGLIGGINGQGAKPCHIDNKVPEAISGVMKKLPGDNPVSRERGITANSDTSTTIGCGFVAIPRAASRVAALSIEDSLVKLRSGPAEISTSTFAQSPFSMRSKSCPLI